MFTEAEVKFIMQANQIETAAGARVLQPITDLRQLGCPANMFNRVLESRAKKLGNRFTEFRAVKVRAVASSPTSLEIAIASAKLF